MDHTKPGWSRVLLFLFFGVTTPLDGVVEILRSKISPAPPEPHSGESQLGGNEKSFTSNEAFLSR